MRLRIPGLVSAVTMALGGCSEMGSPPGSEASDPKAAFDAASLETPVSLTAGRYEISLGGGTLIELKSRSRTAEMCLNSYDATQFPKDPLSWTVEPWETCSTEVNPATGNAMSGARVCRERKMPMTASYTGTHNADSFRIDGVVKQSDDENASVMHLGSGNFTITGKRVGDCSL
jgi:hypothetical protein